MSIELKTASGGSVTLVPEDGVSNVTATVKHESGVLASEAQVEQAEFLAGVGRTWQDVTANRSGGVTYTNNTGRDIVLSIHSLSNDDSGNSDFYIEVSIGGSSFVRVAVDRTRTAQNNQNLIATIPADYSYRWVQATGGNTQAFDEFSWFELR